MNGVIVGFTAFKIHNHGGAKYAAATISAVADSYRRNGIYKALVRNSFIWCLENQCQWQEHNVLATNYPVNQALAKIGFIVTNAFMTFHCWLDG